MGGGRARTCWAREPKLCVQLILIKWKNMRWQSRFICANTASSARAARAPSARFGARSQLRQWIQSTERKLLPLDFHLRLLSAKIFTCTATLRERSWRTQARNFLSQMRKVGGQKINNDASNCKCSVRALLLSQPGEPSAWLARRLRWAVESRERTGSTIECKFMKI